MSWLTVTEHFKLNAFFVVLNLHLRHPSNTANAYLKVVFMRRQSRLDVKGKGKGAYSSS